MGRFVTKLCLHLICNFFQSNFPLLQFVFYLSDILLQGIIKSLVIELVFDSLIRHLWTLQIGWSRFTHIRQLIGKSSSTLPTPQLMGSKCIFKEICPHILVHFPDVIAYYIYTINTTYFRKLFIYFVLNNLHVT